ncbi:hypothetical protein Acsp05_47490 [Actinokineospora sp. NBRC 105648]|nr:hypothetical protein Acsp05_47490 [Actinokineospora sp. NBRC 105648]
MIRQAVDAARRTNHADVAAAWVGSLSKRDLPARSAWGSYVVLKNLPAHAFSPSAHYSATQCGVCGLTEDAELDDRVATYPYQVRHTGIAYAAADLITFPDRARTDPSHDDIECLHAILAALRALPDSAQLTELQKSLIRLFPSNKFQRMILLETFGYAGILRVPDHQAHWREFVTNDDANKRQPPEFFKREWEYPVRFWTGAGGVDDQAVAEHFGGW